MTDKEVIHWFENIYKQRVKRVSWKHLPNKEIAKYLDNRFEDSNSREESYWRILHNQIKRPICEVCGNKVSFKGFRKNGFAVGCCNSHSMKCESTQNKLKSTYIKHYGVDNPAKSKEVLLKSQQTCLDRYGCLNGAQAESVKQRIRQTCLEKYGCENPLGNKDIIRHARNTCLQRYGYEYAFQGEEAKQKYRETCLEKYGVDWQSKTKEARKNLSTKISSQEVQQKSIETKKKRHSLNTSKKELNIQNKLLTIFNVKIQYRSKLYPFNCDFYIPNLDLYIECNFHWTHGGKPYNPEDEDCKEKLKYWESKSENSQFYRNAIHTWTIRDVNKRNIAKENNLNYLVFYSEAEFDNWFNTVIKNKT